jgi:antagonist of KipI
MDPWSHRLANALVGNDSNAGSLEITLVGPELEFDDERVVAIAGAEFDVTLDDRPAPSCTPFVVGAGTQLRFGARRHGARAYVAISGGIDVPPTLGSRATHVLTAMGGFGGRALRIGDRLPLGAPISEHRVCAPRASAVPLSDRHGRIRVLLGPQQDFFTVAAVDALQSAPYTITEKSDRMGFRLSGPTLTHVRSADILSDATPLGALQVPASGQPILLMADRQTTGGYPKIATVITADIGVAGQLGPGDSISFVVCSPREALAALIAQERKMMALEKDTSELGS